MVRRLVALTALLTLLSLVGTALADVAPPNIRGCTGKKAGDACAMDTGSSGVCQKRTCYRNDYSKGVPPTSAPYPCLMCEPKGKKGGPTAPKKASQEPASGWTAGRTTGAAGAGLAVLLLGLFAVRRRED